MYWAVRQRRCAWLLRVGADCEPRALPRGHSGQRWKVVAAESNSRPQRLRRVRKGGATRRCGSSPRRCLSVGRGDSAQPQSRRCAVQALLRLFSGNSHLQRRLVLFAGDGERWFLGRSRLFTVGEIHEMLFRASCQGPLRFFGDETSGQRDHHFRSLGPMIFLLILAYLIDLRVARSTISFR